MPGPNDKPNLFKKVKSADGPGAATSATEREDTHKRKQLLKVASEEVRLRPDSKTTNLGLLTAMGLDEAIKVYREAITVLRAGLVANSKARYDELRQAKALVDEDVNAEPSKIHPSIGKLTALAEAVVAEAKTKPVKR